MTGTKTSEFLDCHGATVPLGAPTRNDDYDHDHDHGKKVKGFEGFCDFAQNDTVTTTTILVSGLPRGDKAPTRNDDHDHGK
jgi:hypothetical protein